MTVNKITSFPTATEHPDTDAHKSNEALTKRTDRIVQKLFILSTPFSTRSQLGESLKEQGQVTTKNIPHQMRCANAQGFHQQGSHAANTLHDTALQDVRSTSHTHSSASHLS